jgi:hypothetical protein
MYREGWRQKLTTELLIIRNEPVMKLICPKGKQDTNIYASVKVLEHGPLTSYTSVKSPSFSTLGKEPFSLTRPVK